MEIGDLFDEEVGLSASCFEELVCGTDYVFRAFAHAYRLTKRSSFTPDLECGTSPCDQPEGCTFTQGYWKTHCGSALGCNANVPDAWPALPDLCGDGDDGLKLGNTCYDKAELLSIFNTPARRNGLIALAHQLISAKLNILDGADGSAVTSALTAADALVGNLIIPPVGTGTLSASSTSTLTGTLDNYNTGFIGPGHCD